MRDDFLQKTKDTLAKRVGYRCCNPGCGMDTVGPNTEPGKVTNIGVAAHITAASQGGPRYDPALSSEQRQDIDNGIWLCQSCAKLIDTDQRKYSTEVLRSWKACAEKLAGTRLNKQLNVSATIPFAQPTDLEPIKANGLYEKEFGGQKVRFFLQGALLHVEHEPAPGIVAYYVLDEQGNVITNKMPYPLEEYTVQFPEDMVISRRKTELSGGFVREEVEMKWGKRATVVWDPSGRPAHLASTGATVNHVEKRYFFQPPEARVAN